MGQGDHPKTFLLKALCWQVTPSWLKVMGGNEQAAMWWVSRQLCGGGWPVRFYCQHWDNSLISIFFSIPRSQVPVPVAWQQSQMRSSSSTHCHGCHGTLSGLLTFDSLPHFNVHWGKQYKRQKMSSLYPFPHSIYSACLSYKIWCVGV